MIGCLACLIKSSLNADLGFLVQASRQPSKVAKPGLHVFSFATNPHYPMVQLLLRSSPYPIKMLGVSEPWHTVRQKFESLHRYLAQNNLKDSNDIILFVDGYDVIFTPGNQDIIKKFKRFNKPLVVSAETNCTPHAICTHPEQYPKSSKLITPFKYANSGTYIGYAWAVYSMLDEALKYPKSHEVDISNDQSLMHAYFINNPDRIALDVQQTIFSLLHGTQFSDYAYDEKTDTLRNRITNSKPLILHGNGGSGLLLGLYLDYLTSKKNGWGRYLYKTQVYIHLSVAKIVCRLARKWYNPKFAGKKLYSRYLGILLDKSSRVEYMLSTTY